MGDRDTNVVELRGNQTGGSGPEEPWKPPRFEKFFLPLVMSLLVLTEALLISTLLRMEDRLHSFDESHVLVGIESYRALSHQAVEAERLSKHNVTWYDAWTKIYQEKQTLELQIQALQKALLDSGSGYEEGHREALDQVARHLGLGSEFFSQLLWTTEICHGDSDLVWMRGQLAEIAGAFGCSSYCSDLVNLTIKDASLEQVIGFISRELGVPVLNEAGITGTVTLRFKEVPAVLALQAIVGQFGADLRFEAGVYRIVPFEFGTE